LAYFLFIIENARSKKQNMVLTLHNWLLYLDQWHNTCKVTNSAARVIQECNFCNNNYKNLAKMRQVHQGAVGLCQKIMTLTWNNCASVYVDSNCHSDYEYDI